jgi:NAD(P)-dependent dehydrogenase (short-subunit alcohol dehydrogenase family)
MGRLTGKVALVTGAARGIGASIAATFAEEGAIVWRTDILPIDSLDGRVMNHDVASRDDWVAVAEAIADRDGTLDVLVNNAGIELRASLKDIALEEWRRVYAVNVDGPFIGCQVFEDMLAGGATKEHSASVVNISSIAGLVIFPDQHAYSTSKAAVRHFSKSLAIEWAAHGKPIRANSIHPGIIRTDMMEEVVQEWVENGILNKEDPWADIDAMTPTNMHGTPRDIAMGAVYLASDEARFVTGLELVIDGGYVSR